MRAHRQGGVLGSLGGEGGWRPLQILYMETEYSGSTIKMWENKYVLIVHEEQEPKAVSHPGFL